MDNPSLRDLHVLLGQWRVELTNAEFLAAGASMSGTMTASWLENLSNDLRGRCLVAGSRR